MATSVYVHIPFCKSKCKYCSFVSFTNEEKKLGYIYALLKEIDINYSGELLKTLYFGGGTPSLIPVDLLKKVINKFNLAKDCEVTLELNPDDVTFDYLKSLKDIGINRISMGAQTFDDDILNIIGRRHTSEDITKAVDIARQAGFENVSLDLIYGLPTQTLETIELDLKTIIDLGVKHVSTYGLKIEEESYFGKFPPNNLPDEDLQADMYLKVNEILTRYGFFRYEVSNFAQLGYESKHNLNYWNNDEYYGFGVAAHGYVDGIRYSNYCNLEDYMNNPSRHESGHVVTEQEKLEEEIFLGFRKSDGINLNKINEKYNIDFEKKFEKVLKKYTPNYIEKTDEGYKLTLDGVLLSNNILSEFLL